MRGGVTLWGKGGDLVDSFLPILTAPTFEGWQLYRGTLPLSLSLQHLYRGLRKNGIELSLSLQHLYRGALTLCKSQKPTQTTSTKSECVAYLRARLRRSCQKGLKLPDLLLVLVRSPESNT